MSPHKAPAAKHSDHRSRIFRDEYAHPVWQVYYGPYWVGAAHTRDVAYTAAVIASEVASQICESGVHQLYLIQNVSVNMPHFEFWEPAKPFFDHKTWRDHLVHPLREKLEAALPLAG